eukprot:365394-Chlamydomonas_euryale.AAC.4
MGGRGDLGEASCGSEQLSEVAALWVSPVHHAVYQSCTDGQPSDAFVLASLLLPLLQVNKTLKWAEGAIVRAEMEAQVEKFLGPKTEADLKPPEKKKPAKAPKV